MKIIMNAENLTKVYGSETVINGISLAVYQDTFTAILGPSGSGKSTLLNILSGLTRPTTGTVCYGEWKITELSEGQLADWKRTCAGNVFQNYLLLNNLTVEENITIGVSPGKTPLSFEGLTKLLEIDHLLDKFPSQLSGGEQQRTAIARAVIKAPRILFCDEATGSLDEANSKKVVGLLHDLKSSFGVTVLFTTHNEQIAKTADRVLTIKNGKLFSDIPNPNPIAASDMEWR